MGNPFWPSQNKEAVQFSKCLHCKLAKSCTTPRMEVSGLGKQEWLILSDAPRETDDKKGIQFVDEGGRLLRKKLERLGANLKQDFRKTNAVCCRPPNGRAPNSNEVEFCRPRLFAEVKKNPPKAVFLLGQVAIDAWWGHRVSKSVGTITKWRGACIPDLENNCWVFHLYDLKFVLKSMNYQPVIETIFENDLKIAIEAANKPLYRFDEPEKRVSVLTDRKDIVRWLKAVPAGSLFVLDYETTGLKPYNRGHEIACVGCSLDGLNAVSFTLEDKRVRKEFCKTLERPDIHLCAQHIQFEDMWSRECLDTTPCNWSWDPMLASHVLDNRGQITGLKWQAFQRWGVIDYDEDVSPWLISNDGGNGFNQVKERMKIPKDRQKILLYAGMDALFEAKLALEQMEALNTFPWDL